MEVTLLILALATASWLWVRSELARREEAAEEEQRENFRRRIVQDPKNIGAYEGLGDSLRQAGRLAEAREAYLAALEVGADEILLDTTYAKLRHLDESVRDQVQKRRGLPPQELYFCRRCGAPNPPIGRACEMCGETIGYDSFWDALRDRNVQHATWESVAVVSIVGLCLHGFTFLPFLAQASVFVATVWVLIWRFLKALAGRQG